MSVESIVVAVVLALIANEKICEERRRRWRSKGRFAFVVKIPITDFWDGSYFATERALTHPQY